LLDNRLSSAETNRSISQSTNSLGPQSVNRSLLINRSISSSNHLSQFLV
jgi:hypothetical protein